MYKHFRAYGIRLTVYRADIILLAIFLEAALAATSYRVYGAFCRKPYTVNRMPRAAYATRHMVKGLQ